MDSFFMLLLVGAILWSGYLILSSRGGVDTATVNRGPEEIIPLAVAQIPGNTMSMRSSWMPAGHSDRSATFVYHRRPSIIIALIGLLFFLVPGILYLVFARKNETLQIDCLGAAGGLTTVQVAASGSVARGRGRSFLKSLPSAPGERLGEPAPSQT